MGERSAIRRHIDPPEAYGKIFEQALTSLPGGTAAQGFRQQNFERFQRLGLPGPKVETWKYSPLGGLAKIAFRPAEAFATDLEIDPFLIQDDGAIRLVFINGKLDQDRSAAPLQQDGVTIASLDAALEKGFIEAADLRIDEADEHSFDALNAAFADSGAVIRIESGKAAPAPVQLLFLSAGDASQTNAETMVNPRIIIELGDGARLDLVETHLLRADGQLTNLATRCSLGKNAIFHHDRLQIGGTGARFIGRGDYRLAGSTKLRQTLATLGGGFVRNEIGARLEGSAIDAQFNGLYLTRTGQHIDNVLQIDHLAPGSVSDQYYRGVLDGKAKAAFAGKIFVHRPAQQTNAYQTNNNLLLSPDAEINTKPELEIYADDVKCSHGATSGELDPQELFYLRSRGLDPETARTILTFAFADEVLERFANPAVLEQAKTEMLRWLPGGDTLSELLS